MSERLVYPMYAFTLWTMEIPGRGALIDQELQISMLHTFKYEPVKKASTIENYWTGLLCVLNKSGVRHRFAPDRQRYIIVIC